MRIVFAVILIVIAGSAPADTVNTSQRTVTRIADGVYVIRHADSPDLNFNGNTTVVIGDRSVLVVDSCFEPAAAQQDIAQIREWTDKPVRYLLNTHFHNDHNMGNGAYAAAFPSIAIIAQVMTAADMYRSPNTAPRLGQQVETRRRKLAAGDVTPEEKARFEKQIAGKTLIIAELQRVPFVSPNLTFDRDLHLDLGNRDVEIRYLGRGPTRGDAIAFLPKEKIVIAGDLVTHPIMFTYDGYPSEWADTLDRLAALDAEIVVPGHGEVLHGNAFVRSAARFIRSVVLQVNTRLRELTATKENPPFEEVQQGVDVSQFRQEMAGADAGLLGDFDDAASALIRVAYNEAMHNH